MTQQCTARTDLERHDVLGVLLARQVHVPELSPPQGLPNVKVAQLPLLLAVGRLPARPTAPGQRQRHPKKGGRNEELDQRAGHAPDRHHSHKDRSIMLGAFGLACLALDIDVETTQREVNSHLRVLLDRRSLHTPSCGSIWIITLETQKLS